MQKISIYSLMVIILISLVSCGQVEESDSKSISSNHQALTNHSSLSIPDYYADYYGNRLNNWVQSKITLSNSGYDQSPKRVEVSLQHPYCGDIQIILESPSGKTIYLRERTQSNKNEKTECLFIEKDITSSFIGDNDGTWILWIIDLGRGDSGELQSWSLLVNSDDGNNSDTGSNYDWPPADSGSSDNYNNTTSSAPAPCNGICTYGATCGDFCPSTATCTWVAVGSEYYPQITACQSTSDYYSNDGYDSGSGYGSDNGYGSNDGYGDSGYGSNSGYGYNNGYDSNGGYGYNNGSGSNNTNCYPWGCY